MSDEEPYDRSLPQLRPRLAASIILTRGGGSELEVLMGRRSAKHVFMPLKYVFPGGRVDRADSYAPLSGDLPAECLSLMTRRMTERRARAAAAAAVRELAEETGLLIAAPGQCKSRHAHWTPFKQADAAPDLSRLSLITRAITPPRRTRRFDTWFFTASADALLDERDPAPSDELEDVRWVPMGEARQLDLPIITHFVLDELKRVSPPAPEAPRWIREIGRKMAVDTL